MIYYLKDPSCQSRGLSCITQEERIYLYIQNYQSSSPQGMQARFEDARPTTAFREGGVVSRAPLLPDYFTDWNSFKNSSTGTGLTKGA